MVMVKSEFGFTKGPDWNELDDMGSMTVLDDGQKWCID